MHMFRRGHLAAGVAIGVAALVAACTPTPGGGPTTTTTTTDVPTPPSVAAFVVKGGVGPAPAVVALSWTVSDPNGDPLTCRLDGDGDGTDDVVVNNCAGTRSRNVELADPGSYTARLTVQDATFPAVEATTTVVVAAGPTETFDLTLRGTGTLDETSADAFEAAEAYWESTIVRGITDFPIEPRPACLDPASPDLPAVVDDVLIDVSVEPIDGAGNILGQAGPTCYNTGNELTIAGVMQFDSADVAVLAADGSLDEVILHEMGHVLGIGTLWDTTIYGGTRKVRSGTGSLNPVYTGGRGVAEYSALGAAGNVPVENLGGPGTRDAHWRETTFGNELMTGFINSGANPVSRLTVASLADLGYQVTFDTAQAYALPGGMTALRAPSAERGGIVLRPVPAPA
jgi:hypothetical protein